MCVNHLLLSFSAYLSYQYSCIQKRSLDIFKLVKVHTFYPVVSILVACVARDVQWTLLTRRGRRLSTWLQSMEAWRCVGLCCRGLATGCSTGRTTTASPLWTSANRGRPLGESIHQGLLNNNTTTLSVLHLHRPPISIALSFSWLGLKVNVYIFLLFSDISNSQNY